jgi:glutamine amidotransferase
MNRLGIIDAGIGNVVSIQNALFALGIENDLINEKTDFKNFSRFILPGVGSFDKGMQSLKKHGFHEAIYSVIDQGDLILGICIGMQLLFEGSEEGNENGLGVIKGHVTRISGQDDLRVPNTGWRYVKPIKQNKLITDQESFRAYHNHSFAFQDSNSESAIAVLENHAAIVVGVQKNNVFGLQFHPEKSHQVGLKLLKNFCDL